MKKKDEFSGSHFTEALLSWYKKNKRDLPWRYTKDPYVIWISEIMLQQTQVKTAIPYFNAFLKRFPNLESLAQSPLQQILKSWEGLGYYRRAHHLHSAAREVSAKYGGKFPSNFESLQTLPGIGLYTAAAIASMAFGQPVPVVDGNVWRVFSRILMDGSSPEKGKKNIYAFLKKIIPAENPSWFNQAMMELGSLVCLPKNPRCFACPVSRFCKGYAGNLVSKFPRKPKRKMIPHKNWGTLLAVHKGKILLQQRPLEGVWSGLWTFPSILISAGQNPKQEVQNLVKKLKLHPVASLKRLEPIHHAFSHFRLTLHPFQVTVNKRCEKTSFVWVSPEDNPYPIPRPYLKIAAM